LQNTPHEHLLRGRRSESVRVFVEGRDVEIRDHRPLVPGSLSLPVGYTIDDFVDELNSRVFLWAGTAAKPQPSGVNHIGRYAAEGEVYVLRVPTPALMSANPEAALEVTFCNSGAARHHQGEPAKRSRDTFIPLAKASRKAADVVELTFRDSILLPTGTEYADSLEGPWVRLF